MAPDMEEEEDPIRPEAKFFPKWDISCKFWKQKMRETELSTQAP